MLVTRGDRLRYALSGMIVAFAAAVCLMVLHPRVSDAYRAFYLDKTTDCWPLPVSGRVALDTDISFVGLESGKVTRGLRRCGWLDPQETGTWASGPEARLLLNPGQRERDLQLILDVLPFFTAAYPTQSVGVELNGKRVADWVLDRNSEPRQTIALPLDRIGETGPIEIAFHLPDAVSPAQAGLNQDRRRVSIRLLSLHLGFAP
jgi:hypothetical protein